MSPPTTSFSGRENGGIPQDEACLPGPISAYGSTKLMGGEVRRAVLPRHFIVRTAWLYSYYGKNFVKTIVNAGKKYGKLEVVNDQLGNPTNAVDLAHEILQLCVTHEYGLYHCTGEGICSWYDFACEIIRLAGVDASVAPCTSASIRQSTPTAPTAPTGARWTTGAALLHRQPGPSLAGGACLLLPALGRGQRHERLRGERKTL